MWSVMPSNRARWYRPEPPETRPLRTRGNPAAERNAFHADFEDLAARQIMGGRAPALAITIWRVAGSHNSTQSVTLARLHLAFDERIV